MTPLDLTKAPPRGPREKLLGVCFLPRTIDKLRGELPGGNAGSYFVDDPMGMSAYILKKLAIDPAALRAVVADATDESDVAVWIDAHADLSGVERLNAKVASMTLGMMPAENRARFNRFYAGAADLPEDMLLFDVFEMDDAKLV